MRHRSPRPLRDLFLRPRVVVLVATLCLGGAGAAGVVSHDVRPSDPPTTSSMPMTGREPVVTPGTPATSSLLGSGAGTSRTADTTTRRQSPSSPTRDEEPPSQPASPSQAASPTGIEPSVIPSPGRPVSSAGDPTPSSSPVDHDAPETTLASRSATADAVTFVFGADEPASFSCRLDSVGYRPCTSPITYDELDAGWHTFAVRSTDQAGNVDPTAATTDFHTDRRDRP